MKNLVQTNHVSQVETYQRKHRGQAHRCKPLLCLASSASPSAQWGAVTYIHICVLASLLSIFEEIYAKCLFLTLSSYITWSLHQLKNDLHFTLFIALCFLCVSVQNIDNLLLVVPETRVVVNVRLCAFVDDGGLTRNLKNRSWAQKKLGRCVLDPRRLREGICLAWHWLPRTLKGRDIAFLWLCSLSNCVYYRIPQPLNSISGSSRVVIFVQTNMACWRIYRLAAASITNWSTPFGRLWGVMSWCAGDRDRLWKSLRHKKTKQLIVIMIAEDSDDLTMVRKLSPARSRKLGNLGPWQCICLCYSCHGIGFILYILILGLVHFLV